MLKGMVKMKKIVSMSVVLMLGFVGSVPVQADDSLEIYTMLVNPYAYKGDDGKVEGAAKEVFESLLKQLGRAPMELKSLPPKRMPGKLSKGNNVLIFPLSYRESRSKWADWVMHINDATSDFATLNDKDFPEALIKLDAKSVSNTSIGVVRGSIFDRTLAKKGFDAKMVSKANNSQQNMSKLLLKRVEYIYGTKTGFEAVLNSPDFEKKKGMVKISSHVTQANIYVAGSKNFDANLLAKIKAAFQALQEDGTLPAILKKYDLMNPGTLEKAKIAN